MRPIGRPETSVRKCHPWMHNIPEERKALLTKKCCMHFLFAMQNGCLTHFTRLDLKNLITLGEECKKG
jgi:hypothetical protein